MTLDQRHQCKLAMVNALQKARLWRRHPIYGAYWRTSVAYYRRLLLQA
jgi:hypothetical protein